MKEKNSSVKTGKNEQLRSHVLIASALFSSSLLFGSMGFGAKAQAEGSSVNTDANVDATQNSSDIVTSKKVATATSASKNPQRGGHDGSGNSGGNVNGIPEATVSDPYDIDEDGNPIPNGQSTTVEQSTSHSASGTQTSTGNPSTPNEVSTKTGAQTDATGSGSASSSDSNSNGGSASSTATVTVKPSEVVIPGEQPTKPQSDIKVDTTGSSNESANSGTTTQSGTETNPILVATQSTTLTVTPKVVPATLTTAPAPIGSTVIDKITLNVPTPTNGTNTITASNNFFVPVGSEFDFVNKHNKLIDVGYNVFAAWQGYAYAAAIAGDAKGVDPTTGKNYLDEWMPDDALQYVVWGTSFASAYSTFANFRAGFSKNQLATMTTLITTKQLQELTTHAPSPYFYRLFYLQSLEGLQYATALQEIRLNVNSDVTKVAFGSDFSSFLWDVGQIGKLPNLTKFEFNSTNIQEISTFKDLKNLTAVDVNFAAINNVSGIDFDFKNAPKTTGGFRYQVMWVNPIILPTGTTSVQIDYNIIDPTGHRRITRPYAGESYKGDKGYQSVSTTADATNVGVNSVVFSNLLTPTDGYYGMLTVFFPYWGYGEPGPGTPDTAPDAFDGYVLIPYTFSSNAGNVNVHYQYLQTDGQQPTIGASETIANTVGTAYDINDDPITNYPMSYLVDKLGGKYIVLDGTGKYSDYIAQNGLANKVGSTGTIAAGDTNLTVVFADTEQITVSHGYLDGANFVPLASDDTISNDINSDILISSLVQTIPRYTFSKAYMVDGNGNVIPIAGTTVHYLGAGIYLQLVYDPESITVPVSYEDSEGNSLATASSITGGFNIKVPAEDLTAQQIPIPNYVFDHFAKADGTPITGDITFEDIESGLKVVYKAAEVTIPIKFVDEAGKPIAADDSLIGNAATELTAEGVAVKAVAIPGYTFKTVQGPDGVAIQLPAQYGTLPTSLMFVYTKNTVDPGGTGGSTGVTPAPKPTETQPALVGHVIYAMKGISLYNSPDFTTTNVLASYVKKPRIYRPRFLVTGFAYDKQGRLRYQVRDVNEKSATFGLTGYVNADSNGVRGAYYQTVPAQITVLNPKGINGYSSVDLKGKVRHYRQGTVLKVKAVVTDRVATRFILEDGTYVTANKTLVKMGSSILPASATKIKALNRYNDVQLKQRNKHFKTIAPQTFRILGWDYSNGYDYQVKSVKRYLVNGGYISANPILVNVQF